MMRSPVVVDRRSLLLLLSTAVAGCSGLDFRSQSPEDEATESADKTKLVGDCTVPFGLYPVEISAVGFVTGLPGTGSDPAPSPERAAVITEMQKLGVDNPNQMLALPTTDVVLVRGYLRPGIQKGDKFDLEVRVPSRSENRGLRGGWMMRTRMTEMQAVGGVVRPGQLAGWGEGPILVDPSSDDNEVMRGRGRILGGGISEITRPLGLVIKANYRNIQVSSLIGTAINRRFHTFTQGVKAGVSTPKTDQFIDLKVHPRYQDNIERYVRVIRSLPLKESSEERLARLSLLERNLLDPISAAAAALKLEAIGKDAVPVLKKGLESNDLEVRFYSAEALAYLDEKSAAAPLGEIAANEPAFRPFALAALGAMDDFDAYEALRKLTSSPSAETRYGAFRALGSMNENDPFVRDARISTEFRYHVLDVDGPPMIHFTRNVRPEIVVFGRGQRFVAPLSLEAGPRILINSLDGERVSVSRFAVGEPDQKRITSLDVDEVLRAVAEVGGTYPDVVQALQEAKAKKALPSRLEMEAVPKTGRSYDRDDSPDETLGDAAVADASWSENSPQLPAENASNEAETAENDGQSSGWWSKMKFWE